MKALLKFIVILLVLIVIVAGIGLFYVDILAKNAVENGATTALGVETTLNSADVGIRKGEFSMAGLRVANPEGYDTDHFLTLNEGSVAVSFPSLMEDTIELPHLTLTGIDMNLEKQAGKANYNVILENLKELETGEEPTEPGKQFIIRKVTVRDITVHTALLPVGGNLTKVDVPIDEIILENVGSGEGDGVKIAELSGVLIKAIFAAVIQKGGDLIPADIGKGLSEGLSGLAGLGEMGIDFTVGALQGVGELGGNITEGIGDVGSDVGKGIGDGVESIGEGIGGFLGGKKKKEDEDTEE